MGKVPNWTTTNATSFYSLQNEIYVALTAKQLNLHFVK
jgi:hypothetical protein